MNKKQREEVSTVEVSVDKCGIQCGPNFRVTNNDKVEKGQELDSPSCCLV